MKNFFIHTKNYTTDFIGSEVDIRYFLFTFYCDFRDYFVTYEEEDRDTESYFDMLLLARDVQLPRLHFSYFRTTIWISIINERIAKGKLVFLTERLMEEVKTKDKFYEFSITFQKSMETVFDLKVIPMEEMVYSYVVSLHCISYCDQTLTKPNKEYVYCREEPPIIISEVNHIFELVFPKELIEGTSLDKMRAFLINIHLLSKVSSCFERVSLSVKTYIKESSPQLYKTWYQTLAQQKWLTIKHLDDVAVTMAMLHFDMISRTKSEKIRVLFAFQGEPGYDNVLVYTTKLLLNDIIQADYTFERAVTKAMILKSKADIVVCNYDTPFIENAPCQIFHLSYIPEASEWAALKSKIVNFKK